MPDGPPEDAARLDSAQFAEGSSANTSSSRSPAASRSLPLVEIVQVQGRRREPGGARSERRTLLLERGDTRLQSPLLGLQIDIGHEALPARDRVRAQVEDRRSQTDAERGGAMFRHRAPILISAAR